MAQSGGSERRDVFKIVREGSDRGLPADFVAYAETFLGVEFIDQHRAPKCLCPFHEDTKPSFSVKHNKGKCFSCQDIRDPMISITDFTAKMLGITPLEAATKIVEDLGL